MILSKEIIDHIAPTHGRTSCSDDNLNNSYGGWNGKFDPDTGKKVINFPRCSRCYLMDNIGLDSESLAFKLDIVVYLNWND